MADVIDLDAERGRRDRPSSEFVTYDDDGVPLFIYTVEYTLDGLPYGFQLWAYDFTHAEEQVAAIRASVTLVGQVMEQVDAPDLDREDLHP